MPKASLRHRLPHAFTALLTAILLPVTATILPNDYGVHPGLALIYAVLETGPLLLSVRKPLLAWTITLTTGTACALTIPPGASPHGVWPWPPTLLIAFLPMLFFLGLRARARTMLAVWAVYTALSYGFDAADPRRSNGSWLIVSLLGGTLLLLGAALQRSKRAERALDEQATISEAERARRTLLEERARIARELHDVVAHHMSVITVQADSAPYRIAGLPPEATEEFGTIAATARESLSEMRRLLGVLRSEDAGQGGGERTPQPGVDRIGQLVEATVRAGQPVELTLDREAAPEALPQAVDLSAYRIVQEALANAVRHAPGAVTRVSVAADADGLTVLVVNAPAGRPHVPLETTGTGHGLVGMRERVRLVGGTLDTGPLPDGGFRVAARLPYAAEALDPVTEPTAPTDKEPPAA
ncbi:MULTISPECIES: sensor histidine kinase [Streptomyces]|uniref:sensor histidine kinase n=1 Tax=Streptomyces TaxID=1883 RepID=UPI00163D1668|nr:MULTISPECIES: sensor histidine kinase [Streptomyces]MBC2874068.1 sensor histidine kinase [Streptomyces sp. TYQ1024]UBI38998.1 sensor histidine kinase [Streptomyces mobaraensis]UKW31576.1 sensor histidine kinase [Streptomyces sp. TYQ1024]